MEDKTKKILDGIISDVKSLDPIQDDDYNYEVYELIFTLLSKYYSANSCNFCLCSEFLDNYKSLTYDDLIDVAKLFAKKNFKVTISQSEESTIISLNWRDDGHYGDIKICRRDDKVTGFKLIEEFNVNDLKEDEENVSSDDSI